MNNCTQCGIQIPEGQRNCSMCYGDVDHGKDGYYRRWLEEQDRRADAEQQQAEEDDY